MSKKVKLKLKKSDLMYIAGALGYAIHSDIFPAKEGKELERIKGIFDKHYTKEDLEELRNTY
jgi:hypothetical protein